MRIIVNGQPREVRATTLADAIAELGLDRPVIASALNEVFIAAAERRDQVLQEGDRLEILSPRQGG